MKTHACLIFLIFCFNGIFHARAKKFALLVATTKTWLHYGDQSTVLHAYQTLIANGFPRRNIITMMYHDIANNERNLEPGIIRNHPRGNNVYENVKIDYTGQNVTADNFVAVLTGNKTMAQGRVIQSTGPKDTLFVYVVGLASYQYLTFPTGPGITARKLAQILQSLTKEKKFNKVFVSADVSFGAVLFDGLLSPKSKVFVSTSTSSVEHPHAVYCFPEKRVCHGSLYGVAWTEYSDRLRQLKSGAKRTLYDQFNHVRAEIPFTHVNIYGDLRVGRSLLKEFIAYKHEGKPNTTAADAAASDKLGLAKNVFLNENQRDGRMLSHEQRSLLDAEDMDQVEKNRNFIKETMKNIFDRLRDGKYRDILGPYEKAKRNRHSLSERHSQVYETAIREFHERCININENPFVLREISKLAHLCESGVDENDLITAMAETCTVEHRLMSNVY